MMRLAPFTMFAIACNSLPPPPAITVRSDAPDVVVSAISQARDAWCVADVGWCPDLVAFGGADIYIRTWNGAGHPAGPGETLEESGWEGPAGIQDAWEIQVPPQFATALDLPWILVHEFGHFCIQGHDSRSTIMSAQPEVRPEPVVDDFARSDWLRDCPR